MDWRSNTKLHDPPRFSLQTLLRELTAPLVAVLLALQTALALLIATRAFSSTATHGAMTGRGILGLLAWAVTAAGLAATVRWAWFAGAADHSRALDATVRYLPLAAATITAASVAAAGAGLAGTAIAWLVLAAEELIVLTTLPGAQGADRPADRWNVFRRAQPDAARREDKRSSFAAQPTARSATVDDIPPADADCVQRLTRAQSPDGGDRLEGRLSTRLAAGQTTAQIHVAFCPSFARVPTIDFRQQSGPPARVKLGQLLPHGARFEVKLPEPAAAATQVTLDVRARHASDQATSPTPAVDSSAER